MDGQHLAGVRPFEHFNVGEEAFVALDQPCFEKGCGKLHAFGLASASSNCKRKAAALGMRAQESADDSDRIHAGHWG